MCKITRVVLMFPAADMQRRVPGQPKPDFNNDVAARPVLEQAVAIAEFAGACRQGFNLQSLAVQYRDTLQTVTQLGAIGSDVLYRSGTGRARDQRQILDPAITGTGSRIWR